MSSYPILDYLERRGWAPKGPNRRTGRCPLPWHDDLQPSFEVYEDHAICYGCQPEGFSLPWLILQLEFGGNEVCWPDAYEHAKDFGYVSNNPLPEKPAARETYPPSDDEKAFLLFARDWWHAILMSEQFGERGRQYFERRGVPLETLQRQKNLGYHPGSVRAQVAFNQYAYAEFGPRWYVLAAQVGILSYQGNPRLAERVMFSCEVGNEVLFYQGRSILDEQPKYQSPWRLNKVPFMLPIEEQRRDPMLSSHPPLVESPFGPAALEQDGIPVVATLGSQVHHVVPFLRNYGFKGPFPLAQDNDEPKFQYGKSVCPGDKQAERVAQALSDEGFSSYRVRPPGVPGGPTKDLDSWRLHQGILPIRAALLPTRTPNFTPSTKLPSQNLAFCVSL